MGLRFAAIAETGSGGKNVLGADVDATATIGAVGRKYHRAVALFRALERGFYPQRRAKWERS